MSLPFMSTSRQEELTKIAAEVITRTSDGLTSPTDALVKVAQDHSLNRNEIQRISEAYNASAQLALMKRAKDDDSIEVDDIIPLADGVEAADKVFGKPSEMVKGDKKDDMLDPENYKADALLKAASAIAPESMTFKEPVARSVPLRKVASVAVGVAVERTPGQHIDYLVKKAEDQLSALKSEHSLVADKAAQLKWAALQRMNKIAEYMERVDAPRFDQIEKVAMALHGDSVNLICKMIYEGCGMKDAGHVRYSGAIPKYASVDDFSSEIDDILFVRDHTANAAVKYAEAEDLLIKCETLQADLRSTFVKEAIDPMSMVAYGLSGMDRAVADAQETNLPAGKPNETVRKDLSFDRMRSALNDLSVNDPVISEFSKQPGAVENAFNELITLNPSLADQPAMLRAALRRHLSTGGDMTVQEAQQLNQPNRV